MSFLENDVKSPNILDELLKSPEDTITIPIQQDTGFTFTEGSMKFEKSPDVYLLDSLDHHLSSSYQNEVVVHRLYTPDNDVNSPWKEGSIILGTDAGDWKLDESLKRPDEGNGITFSRRVTNVEIHPDSGVLAKVRDFVVTSRWHQSILYDMYCGVVL